MRQQLTNTNTDRQTGRAGLYLLQFKTSSHLAPVCHTEEGGMKKTINVNGDIISIEVRKRSYMRNPCGYKVIVNEKSYFFNTLEGQEAMDLGFSKYIKENR